MSVFQFRPTLLESTPRQEFSISTLIFQHSFSFSIFYLPYLPTPPLGQDMTQGQFFTGPTYSLQCDFHREHYHSLISTNSSLRQYKKKSGNSFKVPSTFAHTYIYIYMYIYIHIYIRIHTLYILAVSWCCRIHWLFFCNWVIPFPTPIERVSRTWH